MGGPDLVQVYLLGVIRVCVGDRVLGPNSLGGAKPKQLLEILALARGALVSKERLAEQLWYGDSPVSVSGTLATYVSVLRRRVGLADAIQSSGSGYRLDLEHAQLDVDEFDRLLAAADARHPVDARQKLARALALVRDELLADEPYAEWVQPERLRYRSRHVAALVSSADAALACRDLDAALGHADRALALDPLDEAAARLAVLATYALAKRGDALRRYHEFVAELDSELAVAPMAELQLLGEGIRRGVPAESLLPPVAPGVPQRINDVPVSAVPFLGRERELELLATRCRALRAGKSGLLLVEGPTGMGKTRLVRELGHRLEMRFGFARCFELERRLRFEPLFRALSDAFARGLCDPTSDLSGDRAGKDDDVRQWMRQLGEVVDEYGPAVLVLDDAQWADRSTLAAVQHLTARHSVVVVATVAPRAMAVQHPLRRMEPALKLRLGPLSAQELAGTGVDEVYEVTGGHPLFVAHWLEAARQAGRARRWTGCPTGSWSRWTVSVRGSRPPGRRGDVGAAVHPRPAVAGRGPITLPLVDAVEDLVERACCAATVTT
jgi:DNA-binding SARP family transcriptional activator